MEKSVYRARRPLKGTEFDTEKEIYKQSMTDVKLNGESC